ncbi:CPBP family intramembrane glutamic endopeptidase [Phaeobacter gallaeciensis]|uniref:CPBP family intramembrane glutamic endopeptidase n=1 Tax=Phaeobacter gallaeciensis TaxID=60890 RepID=UPI000BBC043F|nr:CPBP family intramembrane glutamic endopeptidase [Phaeobacter gallaeciensis]ATF16749.1 CAAX protease self-immunity [Phaeobacter gallaeciensis]ATF20858.1 CAAX protease self-immunity [Phaeobacter gallaeciensis]
MFTKPATTAYAAHALLVDPARSAPQLWRLLLGLLLIGVLSYALTAVSVQTLIAAFPGAWVRDLPTGGSPIAMLVLLGSFFCVTIAVACALRLLHRRSLSSVIGPTPLVLHQFGRTSLRLSVLMVGLALLWLILPTGLDGGVMSDLTPNLALHQWLRLLPLALIAIFIQISAEEILFRGYLQQTLAARGLHPLIWLFVPSAIFAVGHYAPGDAGVNAPLIALWAGGFGLLMADLTARAGTLGPAMAVHFVNNIIAILLFGSPTSLSGLALFLVPFELSDPVVLRQMLWLDFAVLGLCWLVARLAIRR